MRFGMCRWTGRRSIGKILIWGAERWFIFIYLFIWFGQWLHNSTAGQLDKVFGNLVFWNNLFPQREGWFLADRQECNASGRACLLFMNSPAHGTCRCLHVTSLLRRIGRNQERTSGGTEGNQGRKPWKRVYSHDPRKNPKNRKRSKTKRWESSKGPRGIT